MPRKLKEIYLTSNLLPDVPDSRDYTFSADITDIPKSADLRKYAGEIENQGSTGSCVANATCSALEVLSEKANNYKDLSRLFLYYNLREPYANLKEKDTGSYTRDGFKFANEQGVCLETTWPFDVNKVNKKPDEKSYTEAKTIKSGKYERIQGFSAYGGTKKGVLLMKAALAKGYPVLIGMALGRSFYYIKGTLEEQAKTPYKGVQNDSIGGHAMNVVGYDDKLNGFIVENSWGERWGDKGYCLIPYNVMIKDNHDAWVCTEFMGVSFKDEWEDTSPHLTTSVPKIYRKNGEIFAEVEILTGTPVYNVSSSLFETFYPNTGELHAIERVPNGDKLFLKYKFNFLNNSKKSVFKLYIVDGSPLEKDKQIWLTFDDAKIEEQVEPDKPVTPEPDKPSDSKTKNIIIGAVVAVAALAIAFSTGYIG